MNIEFNLDVEIISNLNIQYVSHTSRTFFSWFFFLIQTGTHSTIIFYDRTAITMILEEY